MTGRNACHHSRKSVACCAVDRYNHNATNRGFGVVQIKTE